ncbi:unnamed protein product [Tilletia controversa]|nr:unnamed protein product [Tilletia controversa]
MAEHVDHVAMAAAHMFGMHTTPSIDHGHSGMDHGHMGEPAAAACKMGMLISVDWPLHRCVVFSAWHPRTNAHVLLTLLALVALSAAFEYLRWRIRAIDSFLALELASRAGSAAGMHTRKASLVPGSAQAAGLMNGGASTSSGLLATSSTADRRAGPSSRSGSPSHTFLSMADDPYQDDLHHGHSHANGHQDDDARGKSSQRSRTAGSAGSARPSSIVQALFCSPRTLRVSARIQIIRVLLYGLNVAAGAFLMLVLMTYNTWRAMIGHFFFSRELGLVPSATRHQQSPGQASFVAIPAIDADKGLSCH